MEILVGMDPLVPMIAVGVVTAGYTAYGGLPASLETDKNSSMGYYVLDFYFTCDTIYWRY